MPRCRERHDYIAEVFLKQIFWSERKPANCRVQTVGAYNQIKPTFTPAFEVNLYVCPFLQADDLIAENNFCRPPDFFEQPP